MELSLEKFLEEFFSNLTDSKGIENIKKAVKENINEFHDYDSTKVDFHVFSKEDD